MAGCHGKYASTSSCDSSFPGQVPTYLVILPRLMTDLKPRQVNTYYPTPRQTPYAKPKKHSGTAKVTINPGYSGVLQCCKPCTGRTAATSLILASAVIVGISDKEPVRVCSNTLLGVETLLKFFMLLWPNLWFSLFSLLPNQQRHRDLHQHKFS